MIKKYIKVCYQFIKNLPYWYKTQIASFKHYLNDLHYKLHHLRNTNIELGIEHLYKRNLNDAIIRFTLVNKFFSKGDEEANYWLGWAYFLKNNYNKSLYYLALSGKSDLVELGLFLQNYSTYNEIPDRIWGQYRELISEHYIDNFALEDKKILHEVFVQKTFNQIKELPDNYNILELGSNVGIVGNEVRKRFPDSFNMTGVEISNFMNELVEIYYPNIKIYDELLEVSINEFISTNSEKYDIILSCCGLTFTKELNKYFHSIYSMLNNSGFFAFCLPTNKDTKISLERKEYIFDQKYIQQAISDSNFILLSIDELSIGKNRKYSIFVCKKIIGDE